MDEIIDSYVEYSFVGPPEPLADKIKQFALNYKKHFSQNKLPVLDVGIGRGEMLLCMRDWGYDYEGIDISPSTVSFCHSLNLACELVPDIIGALRRRSNRYGTITLLDVLEHIRKDAIIPTLRALREALAPGGSLIIQVPNAQSRDAHLHRYNDITHELAFVEHSLRQVLLASGFTDLTFYPFEPFYIRSPKVALKKMLRALIWRMIRLERRITGNLDPEILAPILVAVARKV
jgi:2-polyprenyl-3-methyl-5-hydroxy-6-metoxy-1,4-benzoquinol methylase